MKSKKFKVTYKDFLEVADRMRECLDAMNNFGSLVFSGFTEKDLAIIQKFIPCPTKGGIVFMDMEKKRRLFIPWGMVDMYRKDGGAIDSLIKKR